MHKLVNGERIELSSEEEAEVKAERAARKDRKALDLFDHEVKSSPMLQAIIQELAVMSERSEETVKAALKAKYQDK